MAQGEGTPGKVVIRYKNAQKDTLYARNLVLDFDEVKYPSIPQKFGYTNAKGEKVDLYLNAE